MCKPSIEETELGETIRKGNRIRGNHFITETDHRGNHS